MKRASYLRPNRAILSERQLRSNWKAFESIIGRSSKLLPVIKANAYGHGLVEMALKVQKLGATGVGVAEVSEALALRAGGYQGLVHCLGAIFPEGLRRALDENLVVTLHNLENLRLFKSIADQGKKVLRLHVKIETGMNRLGLPEKTWAHVARELAGQQRLRVEGIFTHLAESDSRSRAYTVAQLRQFSRGAELFESILNRKLIRHAANSGAILNHPASHFDWVRPGIALYGYPPPHLKTAKKFRPLLTWKAPIVQTKMIAPGETVGYNRTFLAKRKASIATVACGYGDGFRRRFAPVGVGFRGERVRILGIICMDLLMVDVSKFKNVKVGEDITLLGGPKTGAADAYELATTERTIPYEILTGITNRVSRIWSKA